VQDPTLGQALPALATQGGQLVVLKFSREQESEADTLGMRYMSKAGYNPRGQLEVMQILKREAGGGSPPEFLATHPLPDTRIREIEQSLAKDYAATQNQPDKYGMFPERFQQRYLSVSSNMPKKKQPTPKAKGKNAAADDLSPRPRLLADLMRGDPTQWCAVCRDRATATATSPLLP